MADVTPRMTLRQLMRYIDTDKHVIICKFGDADDCAIFKIGGTLLAPYLDYEILGVGLDHLGRQLLRIDLDIPR